ncbi:MAG: alpha/beta hydrolase [Alteromonadaceae bacterium]|nr:alpha/beta hydrolase [Alteromonadaceae bacterium]
MNSNTREELHMNTEVVAPEAVEPKPDNLNPKTDSPERTPSPLPGAGKTVALVLGSGGARGYAHMGVIEVLEEQGYEIIAIAGCSMGALIGGAYAAGKLQLYKDWVTGLGQFDLFRLLDFSLSSPGAIRGDKIFAVISEMLGDINIEDLPIAYTAVATDLLAHKEVWFQEGSLTRAIRASVAIPSFFTPVMIGGRVLVDGALLNPLPIIPTIAAHADLIVAVNLAGEGDFHVELPRVDRKGEPCPPGEAVPEAKLTDGAVEAEWLERWKRRAASWFGTESESSGSEEDALAQAEESASPVDPSETREEAKPVSLQQFGLGKFDIMNLTIETMQSALTQYKIAGYPPDLLVNVPKHVCKSFDYHKAPELIQLGRQLAEESLQNYRRREGRGAGNPLWRNNRRR